MIKGKCSKDIGQINLNCKAVSSKGDLSKQQIIETFFSHTTNYFVILSVIGALIALLPIFLTDIIGSDWLQKLLSTETGFFCLMFLLTAVYSGTFFILGFFILISFAFYTDIIKGCNFSKTEKVLFFTFWIIGLITFISLVLFLLLSWIVKFDYAISLGIILITLITSLILITGFYSVFFVETFSNISNIFLKAIIVIFIVSIVSMCFFFIIQAIVPQFQEISMYYSEKPFGHNPGSLILFSDNFTHSEKTPDLIPLNYTLPGFTGKLTFLDLSYAQCHWSTNYGYFLAINKNSSVIKKYDQDVIITKCPSYDDKMYWSYDLADFGKNKTNVTIGFAIEDMNKEIIIAEDHLQLNWTERDNFTITKA